MENLLKEIEKCEFECEAGSLKGCRAWQELKKRIISTEEIGEVIMKRQFLTTKVVEVEEMTRAEYVKSRGWELPDEKVFKVIYSDGYISTCPKETFLKNAYEIKNNSITPELVKSFVKNAEVTTERIYGKLNTVLKYELVNGFTGVEATSCVDEKNYSEEIGKEILLNRLYDKIWFGLGFALGMANKK